MSTYLYLECRDHHPHVKSDGEVGQHLYDLPDIRKAIAHRDLLTAVVEAGFEVDFVHHFANNTVRFLSQHPNCTIAISDEYGGEHPIVETPPVDPRVAVVQGAIIEAMNVVGGVLIGSSFKPFSESPVPDADVAALLAAIPVSEVS